MYLSERLSRTSILDNFKDAKKERMGSIEGKVDNLGKRVQKES